MGEPTDSLKQSEESTPSKQFLPIGEKLRAKGISAARAESISAARFLPGGQKRANTAMEQLS